MLYRCSFMLSCFSLAKLGHDCQCTEISLLNVNENSDKSFTWHLMLLSVNRITPTTSAKSRIWLREELSQSSHLLKQWCASKVSLLKHKVEWTYHSYKGVIYSYISTHSQAQINCPLQRFISDDKYISDSGSVYGCWWFYHLSKNKRSSTLGLLQVLLLHKMAFGKM